MDAWIWIVLLVLVLFAVVVVVGRKSAIGTVNPTKLSLDPVLMEQVKGLVASNQKIAAIKMLRDANPGLGLAHAKNMVDRLEAAAKRDQQG